MVWSGPMLGFLLSLVVAIPILFAVLMLTSFGVLQDTDESAAGAISTVVSEATESLDTVLSTPEPAAVASAPEEAAAVVVDDASADVAPQLGEVYVVVAGDVLHRIALRFAVTTEALVAYNALSNPNALRIGQELRIPPPGYQPPDPEAEESTDFATGPLSPRG